MLKIRKSSLLATGAIALSMGLSAPAVAQYGGDGGAQQADPGMQQQQAPQIDVSDEQVEQFADAQARVIEIGEKWTPRLEGAESAEDMQEARESAQREMVIAVENAGLSVQEYNEIAQAAQVDEELRERIASQ